VTAATAAARPARAVDDRSKARRVQDALWGSWPRRVMVLAVLVGAVLRLAWVIYAARAPGGLHDPTFYLQLAQSLARGHGYRYTGTAAGPPGPTAYYPIGYPLLLSAWFWLMQHSPWPDHWIAANAALNLVLGTASIALAGMLGRRLAGPWVGAVSAVIVALFPSLIFHTATILTETTFNFVLLCALLVLCWTPWEGWEPSWARLVISGALLGAAIEVRPIALFVVPMVLFALWRTADWRRSLARFAVVAVAALAVMAPWTVRNESVMHAFVPIGTTTGDNLCIGNNPTASGHFALPAWCFGHQQLEPRPQFETDRNSRLTHAAVQWAEHHPAREVVLLADRTRWAFWGDDDALAAVQSYGDAPFMSATTRHVLGAVADIYFYAVLALAIVGIPLLLRGGDRRRLLLLLAIVGVVAAVWPFFGDPRFHVPINVLIPVPAAIVVVTAGRRWGRRVLR
jgi:4-amino-4-deoxy-L-arabinose transferase-like glycosyltransferase